MKRYILCLIFVFLLSFSTKKINAATYFFDDFSNDFSLWNLTSDGYSYNDTGVLSTLGWSIQDGRLKGEAGYEEWSYLYPKEEVSDSNYVIESDVINVNGIDLPIYIRVSDDKTNYYQFAYRFNDPNWSDKNNFTLWKSYNGTWVNLVITDGYTLTQNVVHHIKIEVNGPRIIAYFDNNVVMDYTDVDNPLLEGGFALKNWGGTFNTYTFGKVQNLFEYLWVGSIGDSYSNNTPAPTPTATPTNTPTPTLTPTMTPTPTNIPTPVSSERKVIVLPGLGASWNSEAIVANQVVSNDRWKVLPFVHNYDGLMKTLENKGIESYLWAYDWRKNISNIVSEFEDFLNAKVESDERVDLVGHSLGGLVARMWLQEHPTDQRVGKVLTLGSPHLGTVKAYEVWASGEVPADWGWKSIALNVLAQTQKKFYPTVAEMVRGRIVVLQDLNPTFDFIVKGESLKNWRASYGFNKFLDKKNDQLRNLSFDNLGMMVANGQTTNKFLKVGPRTKIDKLMAKWPDGRPILNVTSDGDGTVLVESAMIGNRKVGNINSKHGDMIDPSIPYILSYFGLPSGDIASSGNTNLDDHLIFFIGSPAYLEVKCDDLEMKTSDELGFVVIDGNGIDSCQIEVVGDNDGTYHLVTGISDNALSWKYFENEIKNGERDIYEFKVSEQGLEIDQSEDTLYELIIRDIRLLQQQNLYKNNKWLRNALMMAERRNIEALMEMVFKFRETSGEYQVSGRIVDNIESLLANKFHKSSRGLAKAMVKVSEINKKLLEKKLESFNNVTLFKATSKESFDNKSETLKDLYENGNYGLVVAREIICSKLMLEIL